jgi:hypothetical protein
MKKRKPMTEEARENIRRGAIRRWREHRNKFSVPVGILQAASEKQEPIAYMLQAPDGDRIISTAISEKTCDFLKSKGFGIWAVKTLQKL